VCTILGQEEIKPHKVRYDLEPHDAEFERKMAEVLCVYREVQGLKGRCQVEETHPRGESRMRAPVGTPITKRPLARIQVLVLVDGPG
jgi:hypothetical protein